MGRSRHTDTLSYPPNFYCNIDPYQGVSHCMPGLKIPRDLRCTSTTEGTPASANLKSATAQGPRPALRQARWTSTHRSDAFHANFAERTSLNVNASSLMTLGVCGAHLPMCIAIPVSRERLEGRGEKNLPLCPPWRVLQRRNDQESLESKGQRRQLPSRNRTKI
jgi:hypothetical protein